MPAAYRSRAAELMPALMNVNDKTKELRVYSFLSRMLPRQSYISKVMLTAFAGIHIPLLSLVVFLLLAQHIVGLTRTQIVVVVLLATLFGMLWTLYALHALLAPVTFAARSLHTYLVDQKLPELPTHYTDDAGRLMANMQMTIEQMDEQMRSLRELSRTDYLTGIYNRAAGEERLAEDVSRARRSDDAMSLIFFDIDYFKQINDTEGHLVGDLCLKHTVETIAGSIRQGDWLARWGGDEFVLVLWDALGRSPEAVLQRIRTALRSSPVHTVDGDAVFITLSMGVCRYNHVDAPGDLLRKADGALNLAKRSGRDRITYAPHEGNEERQKEEQQVDAPDLGKPV